ncbi:MAG: hypothetical protein ABIR30_12420 [Chitinophagaceae bacterium]
MARDPPLRLRSVSLDKSPSTSLRTFYLCTMIPDYPHKLFTDQRGDFNLLMETLAMDTHIP